MFTRQARIALVTLTSIAAIGYGPMALCADTVLLKNGTSLQGEVIANQEGASEIRIHTGLKNVTMARDQIEKIQMDESTRAEFKRRFLLIKGPDAPALFALYTWVKEQRLYGLAEQTLNSTLAADPYHAEAKKAQRAGQAASAGSEAREETAEGPEKNGGIEGLYIAETSRSSPDSAKTKRVEFNTKVLAHAKSLAQSGASEETKQAALQLLLSRKEESGDVLLGALDHRKVTDEETRLGAVKGLSVVKPTGPRVAPTLAWSAVMDPREQVRAATVALIKERKEDAAIGGIIRHLIAAFDESGNVVNPAVRDSAVKALHSFDDRRIGDAMIYYCVLEMRPTVTELANFGERVIQSFTVLQGAAVTITIPLSFPIQFPEIAIRRVRTTVCAPASALNAFAGQDIGGNLDLMAKWAKR